MKTSFKLILSALAAAAALAGCTKENTSPSFENDNVTPAAEGTRVVLVSFAPQTKTCLDKDGLTPVFEDGDLICVANGTDAPQICTVSVDGKITTSLSGPLKAVYPADAAGLDTDGKTITGVLVSTVQSGEFTDANICMAEMKDGNDESLSFENKTAVFCIYPPTENPGCVEVSAGTFNIANDCPKGSDYKSLDKIHVTTTTEDSVWVSILVPAGLTIGDLAFSDGTKEKTVTGDKASTEIAANTLYTVTKENWESSAADIPGGAIKGVFTVDKGADGTAGTDDDVKVHFSQGNLYAKNEGTAGSPEWKWHFYDKQYEYNSIATSSGSRTATGNDIEIDLFTWGYSESTSLSPIGEDFVTDHPNDGQTLVYDRPSSEGGDDWGVAYCESNGIAAGTWRTLTKDEWTYLFNTRTFNNGANTEEGYSYQRATINSDATGGGVYGIILYPDEYTSQKSGNVYTISEWITMEESGCVFLPAAGYRNGNAVQEVGSISRYLSSTANDEDCAYGVCFCDEYLFIELSDSRGCGCGVRLITECQ